MDRNIKKYLFDITEAIACIEEYVGQPMVFANYDSNRQLQQAVERNLEIIGEATRRILEIEPNIMISNARRIVNARNRIIHGYDDIDNTEIWSIIINSLPILKQEVRVLLAEIPNPSPPTDTL
jgi:uncharacterized protein with HEPN domain